MTDSRKVRAILESSDLGRADRSREAMQDLADRIAAGADEYEGHTNRETWAAALWLRNLQPMYEHATDAAVRAYAAGHEQSIRLGMPTDETTGAGWYEDELGDLADIAERYLVDKRDGTPSGMLGDIGSLWRVDYRDLFRTMLPEDADELRERARVLGVSLPVE